MSTSSAGAAKSCLDCPSYVPAPQTITVFNKTPGAPMCQRFGYVLGVPGMAPADLTVVAERRAENCESYGQQRAIKPGTDFLIAIPDPNAREDLSELDPRKSNCKTCGMCKNFVPDDKVQEEYGFVVGLCAAKGRLSFPSRRIEDATGCRYRQIGPVRQSANLLLLPILQVNRSANKASTAIGVDSLRRHPNEIVDPKDYVTDRDVLPDEVEAGIRAWRKIEDPEGTGNSVFMPIYDPKFFSEEDQAQIPQTGDDEHPELYLDWNGAVYKIMTLWRELDETPMIWGVPGVGKTEVFRYIAWLMQMPFYRVSITGSSELDDLAGKMLFDKDKGTYFHLGRIPMMWGKPCVGVIDEPNTAPPEVLEFFRPMFDNSKQLVLDMSSDPTPITRHTECHIGLAANPAWNALNVGTNVMSDADVSRLMHIEFDLPPESIERAIIKNRVRLDGWEIDDARLDFIMHTAEKIRELCNDQVLTMTWGIRPQLKVARSMAWFDPLQAYRLAVADMMEPQQRQALLDQVRAHLPSGPRAFPPVRRIED